MSHAFLPRLGDVVGQVQAIDAGVVLLQVLPEALREFPDQLARGAVVDGRGAFTDVPDDQVAGIRAGQAVEVDHVGDVGPLPALGIVQGRRSRRQDTELSQQIPGQREAGRALPSAGSQDTAHVEHVLAGQTAWGLSSVRERNRQHADGMLLLHSGDLPHLARITDGGEELGIPDLAQSLEPRSEAETAEPVIRRTDDVQAEQDTQPVHDLAAPEGTHTYGVAEQGRQVRGLVPAAVVPALLPAGAFRTAQGRQDDADTPRGLLLPRLRERGQSSNTVDDVLFAQERRRPRLPLCCCRTARRRVRGGNSIIGPWRGRGRSNNPHRTPPNSSSMSSAS
ncbi:hypothetical protein [Streptomyces tubercidicus]